MEYAERVLVYDRIDANRRSTRLLLGLFAVVLLPAAAYVTQYLMFVALLGSLSLSGSNIAVSIILAAIIALAIIFVAAYLQYRYASALVLRLAGAREVERDQEPDLWRTVENLCIGAGLPQPRVYVVEDGSPNAFATGLDPESASLVVTRGLLEFLDRRELEGVIAHELSHIGNYDTRLSTILAVGVGILRLPFVIVSGFFRFLFRLHWIVGAGALLYLGVAPLLGVAFGLSLIASDPAVGSVLLFATALPVYVVLGAPLLGLLIQRAIAQQREFLADADAVLLTRDAEGLATALTKMSAAGGLRMKVGGATAYLYIANPLPGDAPWWDTTFATHPPVEERIAALAGMGGGISPSVLREAAEAGAKFTPTDTAATVVATPRWEERALADEATESAEAAPPAEPRRAPGGFRLTGEGTTLYGRPDTASAALRQLPGGALITVIERQGDFLRVITVGDRFGYILRSTPMTEADLGS